MMEAVFGFCELLLHKLWQARSGVGWLANDVCCYLQYSFKGLYHLLLLLLKLFHHVSGYLSPTQTDGPSKPTRPRLICGEFFKVGTRALNFEIIKRIKRIVMLVNDRFFANHQPFCINQVYRVVPEFLHSTPMQSPVALIS